MTKRTDASAGALKLSGNTRFFFILAGNQVKGAGRSIQALDTNTTGRDDVIGRAMAAGGSALESIGSGDGGGANTYLKAAADALYEFAGAAAADGGFNPTGNARFYFILSGNAVKGAGRSIQALDANATGQDDILGAAMAAAGQGLEAIGSGNAQGANGYIRAAADGIYAYLGLEPPQSQQAGA